MICKRMPVRGDGAAVARQVEDLLGYVDRIGRGAGRGDLVALGGRNFVSTARRAQAAEMIATLTACPRARRPLEHLVLSWRPDEQPDLRQVAEAVAILVRGLGLARHQALWALHGDAAGAHLHLVVARVDPETSRPAVIPMFINELDRAVARIEHAQGWQPEANARFRVVEGIDELTGERSGTSDGRDGYDAEPRRRGGIERKLGEAADDLGAGGAGGTPGDGRDPDGAATGRGRARSGRSGRGDRRAADGGRGAGRSLGRRDRGAAREPGRAGRHGGEDPGGAGSGGGPGGPAAAGRAGTEGAAGAVAWPDPARAGRRLRDRLTALRLRAASWQRQAGPDPGPGRPSAATEDGASGRRRARARARLEALIGDEASAQIARKAVAARLRGEHPGRWDDLPLARTLTEADTLSAPAATREVRRGERSPERVAIEVAGPLVDAAGSWAALHAALAREGIAYRRKGSGAVLLIGGVAVKASTYRKAALGALVARLGPYRPDAEQAIDAAAGRSLAHRVEAAPGVDPRVFAALQGDRTLSARAQAGFAAACAPLRPNAWRAAALFGERPRVAADARAIADRLGLPRPRLAPLARPEPTPVDAASALGACHAALGAERYGLLVRMPAVQRASNPEAAATAAKPGAPAEPYDRLLRMPLGPLAAVQAAWPRVAALARAGASVHLRFAGGDRHHVVLRDLNARGLARMGKDGHTAALVMEGPPGRYEAVLRAPGGAADEPDAVRRVARALARRYGCAVSRVGLRVVRAPEPDAGSVEPKPGVAARFVARAGEICARLATLIARAAQRLRALRALLPRPVPRPRSGSWWRRSGLEPPTREAAAIYHAHRRDIVAGWDGRRPDNSRIDARVARRLRATGHAEPAVAALVAACAVALEPYRRRDWAAYGRRAAARAFASDGAADATDELDTGLVATWAALERRTRKCVAAGAEIRSAAARSATIAVPAPIVSPVEVERVDGIVAQPVPEATAIAAPVPAPAFVPAPPSPATSASPTRGPPATMQVASSPPREARHDRRPAVIVADAGQADAMQSKVPASLTAGATVRTAAAEPSRHVGSWEIVASTDGVVADGRTVQPSADPSTDAQEQRESDATSRGASDVKAARSPPIEPPHADVAGTTGAAAWSPLADVPARERSLACYYTLALASPEATIRVWRACLKRALGAEISSRVETWHQSTHGTPEHRRILREVGRWTGGWNFNAVTRACENRGVKVPGR